MAITSKINTLSLSTSWVWELFPYDNLYPTDGEFGSGAPSAANVVSSPGAVGNFGTAVAALSGPAQAFAGQLAVVGPGESKTLGIKQFSINRSKSSPDGVANLSVVGHPPKNAYPGVWCCLTTVNPGTQKKRVRFIGQIDTMSVSYQTQPSGLVATVVSYKIREWSSVLRVPVRVESLTVSQAMYEPSPFNAATFAANKLGEKVWLDVIKSSYNPFQMAVLALQLLGAVSADNSKNTIEALAGKNYHETAARMPVIPPALITRLGITSNNQNPFASGFVKFINGIRKDGGNPKIQDGSWDGIFGKGGIETIDAYQDRHETENTGRPVGSNIGPLMSLNHSGWDLLTQYCDPAHNEFFTDLFYEQGPDGNEITQPVFVFRDKPFLLNSIKEVMPNASTSLSKFSMFDTLPRVRLNQTAIMNFNFVNTILNSPNLIRVDWTDGMIATDTTKQMANARGYNLLLPEMLRFGGQEYNAQTNFVEIDPTGTDSSGVSSAEWWASIRDVVTAWHSYHYRMGNGMLVLKDDNSAVSIGHNVEFQFGNFVLVGHVDAVNFSVVVDEKGLIQNTLQLSLSRIVQKKDNKLIFISPDQFGSLADPEAVPATPPAPAFPGFPSVGDLIGGAVDAIAGLFA